MTNKSTISKTNTKAKCCFFFLWNSLISFIFLTTPTYPAHVLAIDYSPLMHAILFILPPSQIDLSRKIWIQKIQIHSQRNTPTKSYWSEQKNINSKDYKYINNKLTPKVVFIWAGIKRYKIIQVQKILPHIRFILAGKYQIKQNT